MWSCSSLWSSSQQRMVTHSFLLFITYIVQNGWQSPNQLFLFLGDTSWSWFLNKNMHFLFLPYLSFFFIPLKFFGTLSGLKILINWYCVSMEINPFTLGPWIINSCSPHVTLKASICGWKNNRVISKNIFFLSFLSCIEWCNIFTAN